MAHHFRERFVDACSALVETKTFGRMMVVMLALVATAIVTWSFKPVSQHLELGAIATADIKADRDYEIVDDEATANFRRQTQASVLALYTFDEGLVTAITERVRDAFQQTRSRAYVLAAVHARANRAGTEFLLTPDDKVVLRALFVQKAGITPSDAQWQMLIDERFGSRVEHIVVDVIERTMRGMIVAERGTLDAEKGSGIIVRRARAPEGKQTGAGETKIDDFTTILSTEEARHRIATTELSPSGLFLTTSRPLILELASSFVEPNCIYARQETETRRAEAAATVKNVVIKVSAGEMIVRNGSRFEPWHLKVLSSIQRESARGRSLYQFAGSFLVVLLAIVMPFLCGRHGRERYRLSRKEYGLMAAIGLVMLVVLRITLAIAPAVGQSFYVQLPDKALSYAVPVAAAAMMVRMFLRSEAALLFSFSFAVITGLFVETGLRFTIYALLTNITAIIAVARADRRMAIFRSGTIVGMVAALIVVAIRFMSHGSVIEELSAGGVAWLIAAAFSGGIMSALVAMIALPIFESLTGFVTDIKLLELANLNHPLLRELIVRAPGTYHHSHLVGILAEAAAEAVGANALLVRVGAYYHDIGKMKKPLYFAENMRAGESRHDRLTAHMSALIVASHVREGMEMAAAARIPKAIIDMIPEHHGTRMIGTFYEKAKAAADPDVERIDRREFAYGGPKPQTREAAILMLADVTEASVRALKEKSAVRIEQTVKQVIDDIFLDSQLDECDLTLRDLDAIAKAFVHILLGIYHQRIEYLREEKSGSRDLQSSSNAASGARNPQEEARPAGLADITRRG